MTLLVPIKRVLDPYAKARLLADGSGFDDEGQKHEINPFDEIALEEAVRTKELRPDTRVVIVSVGGSECEEQLRKGLAMGADEAVLVETTDTWDSPSIAAELAQRVRGLDARLVLMGKQSTDSDCGQVGPMLAALLDWPQVTFASKLEWFGDRVRVTRETDEGEETIEAPMPCVITADLRLNEPRYIALPGVIKARSKPLRREAPLTSPSPRTNTLGYKPAPSRPPSRKVGSVDDLVAALKERGAV